MQTHTTTTPPEPSAKTQRSDGWMRRLVRNLRFRAVVVKWTDSHYRPGWDNGDVPADELMCYSVGWLISETKQVIVVASHVTDEESSQRCGQMTIPRKAIITMKYL